MSHKTSNSGRQNGRGIISLQTTLYDLIAAINEEIMPEEDWAVTDAVLELFETGRARFLSAN